MFTSFSPEFVDKGTTMNSQITYLKKLELLKELDSYRDGEFYAVIDQRVKNHLPQWIQFSPNIFWINNPEEEKNLETYGRIIEFLLRQGIQRKSVLYAFGGGATTDLAGFVAATILRGINWVSVPTTLLGMIDGSIGGKVAINMPQGKNLVGAFHSPTKVYICGDFLTTVTDPDWLSGKGELLKYAFLSKDIYNLVIKKASIEEIAIQCAKYKMNLVERDFKDRGDRILLNLGHTLGHAFESTLKIPHGQAVGMGLKYLMQVMSLEDAYSHWGKLLDSLSLNEDRFDIKKFKDFKTKIFMTYLEQDKKRVDSKLRLVLVKSIGDCYVEEVNLKDFKAKILNHDDFKNF